MARTRRAKDGGKAAATRSLSTKTARAVRGGQKSGALPYNKKNVTTIKYPSS